MLKKEMKASLGYIGSKKRLISFLDEYISPHLTPETTFGDLFAGTGVVGEFFSHKAKQVISNDVEYTLTSSTEHS